MTVLNPVPPEEPEESPAGTEQMPTGGFPAGSLADILLKDHEELYRALVYASPDGIVITDLETRITFASPAILRDFELDSPEQILGTLVTDWVDAEDQPRHRIDIRNATQGNFAKDSGYSFHTLKGNHFTGEINAALLRDASGRASGFIGSIRDITYRKQTEEALRASVENLKLLRLIDRVTIEHDDLQTSLEALLDPIAGHFHADAAEILLYEAEWEIFHRVMGHGFRSRAFGAPFKAADSFAGHALSARSPIFQPDLAAMPGVVELPFIAEERFVSGYSLPLMTPKRVQGVLQLFYRARTALGEEDRSLLEMIANQVAIAVEKSALWENHQRALQDLVKAYTATLEGWVYALDMRDNETEQHTRRVSELTAEIAGAMGFPPDQLVDLRRGVLLHDIGKIGIPDGILLKPGPLSDAEWAVMRQHPEFAYNMLQPIQYLHSAIDIPYCHHERWDGSGYPRGLKGEEIPLAARIFAVVDVWDALTSDRPYRKAWSKEEARRYLQENAGKLFDPRVVEIVLGML